VLRRVSYYIISTWKPVPAYVPPKLIAFALQEAMAVSETEAGGRVLVALEEMIGNNEHTHMLIASRNRRI